MVELRASLNPFDANDSSGRYLRTPLTFYVQSWYWYNLGQPAGGNIRSDFRFHRFDQIRRTKFLASDNTSRICWTVNGFGDGPIFKQVNCCYNARLRLSYMSPSSRGLGHRPFTAITRVRISLGTPSIKFKISCADATQRFQAYQFEFRSGSSVG